MANHIFTFRVRHGLNLRFEMDTQVVKAGDSCPVMFDCYGKARASDADAIEAWTDGIFRDMAQTSKVPIISGCPLANLLRGEAYQPYKFLPNGEKEIVK